MPDQSSQEAQLQIGDQIVTVRLRPLGAYETNPHNTNRGSERGVAAIEHSVQDTGWGRGIVVAGDGTIVGGNHATEAAEATEAIAAWIEVETTGNVGVATRRIDWTDARSPEAIRAGLADNRTSQLNFNLDLTSLASDLESLAEVNVSIPKLYYTPDELTDIGVNRNFEPASQAQQAQLDATKLKPPKEINCTCPSCGHEFIRQY